MYNYTDDQYGVGVIRALEIVTQKDDTIYKVIYFGQGSTFDNYLPTVNKMIESIEIFKLQFYEDVPNQLQIKYPSTWYINNTNNTITLNPSVTLSPRDNLTIRSFNSAQSLNTIIDRINGTKKLNYEYIGKSNRTIQTTLGNNSIATELSYGKNGDGLNVVDTEILTEFNNKTYLIELLSKENRYSTIDLPQFINDTINRFRIIEFTDYKDKLNSTKQGGVSYIEYPRIWTFIPHTTGFVIWSPLEKNDDNVDENLGLTIEFSQVGTDIESLVSNQINNAKGNLSNFQLIDSEETTLFNKPAHKVIYTYKDDQLPNSCQCDIKVMSVFTIINNKAYTFDYMGEMDKFSSYLQTIEAIINSTKVLENTLKYTTNKSGLPLNGGHIDIAINPVTNRIYVAIPDANQIQVINGFDDTVIKNITVGGSPNSVALNAGTNKIYVADPESDMIYVIDGLTNNITRQIQAGRLLGDIAVNTDEFGGHSALVFVANTGNDSVSIIDDVKGKVVSNIKTTVNPFGIGIDTIKNRAYITTDTGIDIIDYISNLNERSVNATYYDHINVGYAPFGIVVDPDTSRAYITNFQSDTISVIDTTRIRIGTKKLKWDYFQIP